jgi:hypothetical protein
MNAKVMWRHGHNGRSGQGLGAASAAKFLIFLQGRPRASRAFASAPGGDSDAMPRRIRTKI